MVYTRPNNCIENSFFPLTRLSSDSLHENTQQALDRGELVTQDKLEILELNVLCRGDH